MELRWHEYGVSIKRGADGLEDGEAVWAAGIDDGTDSGEEVAAPLGTEAVGYLAEDDAGTQRPFGGVVGIGDRTVGGEDEEVGTDFGEALAQANAVTAGRPQLHDRVDTPLEVGTILAKRAVLEPLPSPADGNGAKQNPFHHRSEDAVAGIDSILDIAKLVGEANLPVPGVSLLGAGQVGDPDRGPSIPEDLLRHLLAPAGLDDMEDGIGAGEDPFPPVRPSTRAEVSSEQTMELSRTRCLIAIACSSKRGFTLLNRLASAPSLMGRPKMSRNRAASRSKPMAWQWCRQTANASIEEPKGEPGARPGGGRAVNASPQWGQAPPCRRTWVTMGLIGGLDRWA